MNPINELVLTVLAQERPQYHRIAVRIVGRAEDAEDVLQTCAVQLAQARLDHVPPQAIRAYLTQAVRNRALDFRRAQWRAHCKQAPLTDVHANTGANPCVTPLDELLTAERVARQEALRDRVRRGLSDLPREQQRAVRWMYLCLEPMTLASLAQAEDIPLTTARSRVLSGLHRLRRMIASVPGDTAPA